MKRISGHWRRLAVTASVIVALFVGFGLLRLHLGLQFSVESLRATVDGLGVWAPVAYVGFVAFRVPLGFPSQIVLLGGGLLFGTFEGTLYGAVGLTVSAVVLFLGSRWAGREVVEARIPERLRPLLDIASSRAGTAFIAVGTGYPFGPVTVYHISAGVTAMAFVGFAIAAAAGSTVRSATFTYFGSSLVSGQLDRVLLALFVLSIAIVLPLLFPRPRAWLRQVFQRDRVEGSRVEGSRVEGSRVKDSRASGQSRESLR